MPGLLQNHIAAVTGAGSGIGRAIARGFAREGAVLALLDSNGEAAAKTAAAVRDAGGEAKAFALDVADRAACRNAAAKIAGDVGAVSVLVNNAGIIRRNPFTEDAEAVAKDWADTLSVNLNGVFNVTQAFLPPLRAAKGRIINIASIQSFVHVRTPSSPAYTTSKHGVLGFTRALAAELGKDGVRVNAIGPASSRRRSTKRRAPTIRNSSKPFSTTPRSAAPAVRTTSSGPRSFSPPICRLLSPGRS
jgi:NAD(P)-dependent dehydrogenase (short-subunit alcohol dehydrogenase family)